MKGPNGYCNKLEEQVQFHNLNCDDYNARNDIFHILGCGNCIHFKDEEDEIPNHR